MKPPPGVFFFLPSPSEKNKVYPPTSSFHFWFVRDEEGTSRNNNPDMRNMQLSKVVKQEELEGELPIGRNHESETIGVKRKKKEVDWELKHEFRYHPSSSTSRRTGLRVGR